MFFRYNPFNDPFFHSPMRMSKAFDSMFNDFFHQPRYYRPKYYSTQQQQQQQQNSQQNQPEKAENTQQNQQSVQEIENAYKKYEKEYQEQVQQYNEAKRKMWEQEQILREKYDKKQQEYYKLNPMRADPFDAFFWHRDPFFDTWPFARQYIEEPYENQPKNLENNEQQQQTIEQKEDQREKPEFTQKYYRKSERTHSYLNDEGQRVVTSHLVENKNGEEVHKLVEKIFDKDNNLMSQKTIDGEKAIEDYQKGQQSKIKENQEQQKIENQENPENKEKA
ncbi:hypothetical protein PPERSA_05199 [Pseudocohnilembus persalinus]|uniref:Uncharacterized protein n=1 Tax=Pseudocohnilembus persalinus TaxID=266149 RepID=A0A0V0R9G8_PSEPJ|nr:hypothetical protein PPERSA_05199 [Pseudocohnilembus persalinus]|eukprot:KRX11090.1 hypothetical protein PPERSA_05199 [Pseudocohnilembus persalinus]